MIANEDYSGLIVRTELGSQTGDEIHQTADGRWWSKWDGTIRTGEELRRVWRPSVS